MTQATYSFETVDVFTEQRFGGNPLAIFPDAAGMSPSLMQALAAELNLSETAFVLPPSDPRCDARVRIFNRTAEMAFAGHPCVGTAWALARLGRGDGMLRLEVSAGIVEAEILHDAKGAAVGATIEAPQPLTTGEAVPAATAAECLGLLEADIRTDTHLPTPVSMGNPYLLVELWRPALGRCDPRPDAFRVAQAKDRWMNGRFSILAYAREGSTIRCRMFAPLAGTIEDPATGSANAPLAGFLLARAGGAEGKFAVIQGVEMGRPSAMTVTARRSPDGYRARVSGRCVPVFQGAFPVSAA